jgi:uncharacterized repeat protein (TIGR03803 family)
MQAADGNLYGTTSYRGNGAACLPNQGCGTVFKISLSGALTTVYNFCSQPSCADGGFPAGPLVQATDGNFYGTTSFNGPSPNATIFKVTPKGALTTLHSFNIQGATTQGDGVIQDTSGKFYGTTMFGGITNFSSCFGTCGTAYALSVGLGPFVETLPTGGEVETSVQILGSDLAGATSVTFNGVAAPFTVESATLISATVPTGATTGKVQVVTPTRTLKSNVIFHVRP